MSRLCSIFQNRPNQKYYVTRDMLKTNLNLNSEDVTSEMVFIWKHIYVEELPAGIHDDATDEERDDVAMQLIEHISDIRRVSRHIIDELFIDYANKELGMKHLDGQPISCFAELARTAREMAKEGEDGKRKFLD